MDEGDYVDGKKHGLWTTYYANGNKRSEGEYNRGKKEGVWIQYFANGNKMSEGTFVEGKFTGLYTSYHENGNRKYQGYYNEHKGVSADGTKEGVWDCYEQDGETIWRKITYHRGSRTKPDEIFRSLEGNPDAAQDMEDPA
jgi:antitoxin component YwqK of YwqJK toxin-antitoxin module